MKYDQLERCFKSVMEQRNKLHDQLVEARIKTEDLEDTVKVQSELIERLRKELDSYM